MCVWGGGQSCYGSFNANSISFQLGPNVAQRQCRSDTMKCGYLACRVKEGGEKGSGRLHKRRSARHKGREEKDGVNGCHISRRSPLADPGGGVPSGGPGGGVLRGTYVRPRGGGRHMPPG